MTKKYSDEISETDLLPLIINPNGYKSVEEEFNEALQNITFAGMADECFEGFFMWWSK